MQAERYVRGEGFLEEGRLEAAKQEFEFAEPYLDAAERAQECVHMMADMLEADGNLLQAALAFIEVKDYSDSLDRAVALAEQLFQSEKYDDAAQVYEALGNGYEEQLTQASTYATEFEHANQMIDDQSFETAIEDLTKIPGDFAYRGITAEQCIQQIKKAQAISATGGKFVTVDLSVMKVVSTSKSTGSWHSWENDAAGNGLRLIIRQRLLTMGVFPSRVPCSFSALQTLQPLPAFLTMIWLEKTSASII